MEFYSQDGQDKYLNFKVFCGKTGGVFLDIGASDGKSGSNTYFFEKQKRWTGICVEPRKTAFEELKKHRDCICENCCISSLEGTAEFMEIDGRSSVLSGLISKYDRRHLQRIEKETEQHKQLKHVIEVNCMLPGDLLKKHNINKVDFCSIDVEGSELDIVKAIDFELFIIDVFSIENPYDDLEVELFLATKEYRLIKRIGHDEIFKKVHSLCGKIYLRILTLKVVYPVLRTGRVFRRRAKDLLRWSLIHTGLFNLVKRLYKKSCP